MAESNHLDKQYSPDHRSPYRTNEAFHYDPDEEEILARQLEGKMYTCSGLIFHEVLMNICLISLQNESRTS